MNYNDYFNGYDPSYELVFHSAWSSYEEHGWIFIFQKDKKFFSIEGGYCVMSEEGYKEANWSELVEISQEEALNLMLEWSDNEESL